MKKMPPFGGCGLLKSVLPHRQQRRVRDDNLNLSTLHTGYGAASPTHWSPKPIRNKEQQQPELPGGALKSNSSVSVKSAEAVTKLVMVCSE